MDKFKEIRPVVLGLIVRDHKVLVSEGHDPAENNKVFYRCLGGGIEFLETAEKALKREFQEELGIDIKVKDYVTHFENIFKFNGKDGHELILVYNADMDDKDIKDVYYIKDERQDDGKTLWVDIDEFKNHNKIIYPEGIIDYLK